MYFEVYTDTTQFLTLSVYQSNALIDPDGSAVSVSVYKNGVMLGAPISATKHSTGIYKFLFPMVYTDVEDVYQVRWDFTISSVQAYRIDKVAVVTPYAEIDNIALEAGLSLTPGDSNYKSIDEITRAETQARRAIEAYTGQFFGRRGGSEYAEAAGNEILTLSEPVIQVNAVYYGTRKIYDHLEVDNEAVFETSPTGQSIVGYLPLTDGSRSDTYASFARYNKYIVEGIFGYETVPADIQEAATVLAAFYLCKDSTYWNRFIKQVKFGESQMAYDTRAFGGTGVAYVDMLLDPYRLLNMFIV